MPPGFLTRTGTEGDNRLSADVFLPDLYQRLSFFEGVFLLRGLLEQKKNNSGYNEDEG
jgi:hypothetical protein